MDVIRRNTPELTSHFRLALDMTFLFALKMASNRTMIAKMKNTPDLLIRSVES